MRLEREQLAMLKEILLDKSLADDSGCWIWQGSKSGGTGYGHFNKFKQTLSAHRVAYQIWNGSIPDGMCVLHMCDVRACCNPEHLFLGTHADNVADKVSKDRQSAGRGERHGKSKLTERAVKVIRVRFVDGASHGKLAARYMVSKSAIRHIVTNRTWR